MKSCTPPLIEQQTNILSNYALSKLLTFFLTGKNSIFLYDTIAITKEETKKEINNMGKTPPTTKKYSVYAEKHNDKLQFFLRAEGFSDIEFYSIMLINNKPSVRVLKTIVKTIVKSYRPIPTTIDKSFSEFAHKYHYYLVYHQIKRSWQNGYFPKHPLNHRHSISKSVAHECYTDFWNDITQLANTYKVFCKILIDIYREKIPAKYLSTDKIYILNVDYTNEFGVSLALENLSENHSYHEVIKAEDFVPVAFSDNQLFIKGIYESVSPIFSKT